MSLILPKTCSMGGSKTCLVGTIGVTLLNPDGTVHTARATAGIYEIGGGCYGKEITFDDNWKGSIKWDTGGGSPVYATEDYDVEGLIDMIEEDTSKMNFTGTDIKATLDGEKVVLTNATETQIDDIENATIIKRATINDATPTTTKFITTLTETASTFWPRAALLMTSGQNKGQIRGIKSYNGSTKEVQVQTPLSYTPADGDAFWIIPTRKFLMPDIENVAQASVCTEARLAQLDEANIPTDIDSVVAAVVGVGALSCIWTQKDDGGVPMDNVQVWISTDEAGSNVIAGTLLTDANGEVTFMLDAGTYYVFRERAGYNFTNPKEWSVS